MGQPVKRSVRVTLPDGQVVVRNSSTKVYTHAVAILDPMAGLLDSEIAAGQRNTTRWTCNTFAASEELAHKEASTRRNIVEKWRRKPAVRVESYPEDCCKIEARVLPVEVIEAGTAGPSTGYR